MPANTIFDAGATVWGAVAYAELIQVGDITWTRATEEVKFLAKEAYGQDVYPKHRGQYVHASLLSKLWFSTQIFRHRSRTNGIS